MVPYKEALLPLLEEAELIESSHWPQYEAPEEVVKRIAQWSTKNFGCK